MKVEIWSDIVCPFCYIGKRNFESALDGFAAKYKVSIEWKSFQLDPEMDNKEGLSVHEYLGRRKGGTTADGKRMNDQMSAIAKEVGLHYDFDKAIINNTLNAHRLLHFAKQHGLQNSLKERIFKAYYTQGKDIADTETLAQLSVEVGLNEEQARTVLQDNLFEAEVINDQHEALEVGVQGVPFYVFNGKYAVSGAQSPEAFAQVLNKVWEEEQPELVMENNDGFCDINGNC
ncbi:MAG: DsbA family oxidoreductase [Chitinophagaceae bacterium]|nr:DsbA family oxidoreductase [Chitinophagaceae bacterium]